MTSSPPIADRPSRRSWASLRPRRSPRLGIRGLMLSVAVLGVLCAIGRFWILNSDPDNAVIQRHLRTLADPEAGFERRLAAIDALRQADGWIARRALNALAARLDDEEPQVRAAAADSIGDLGASLIRDHGAAGLATARRPANALFDAIDDPDGSVGSQALRALERIALEADATSAQSPPTVAERLEPFLAQVRSGELPPETAATLIQILHRLEGPEDSFLEVVTPVIRDLAPEVRAAIVVAVAERSNRDGPAPPLLLEAVLDSDPEVRRAARWAVIVVDHRNRYRELETVAPSLLIEALLDRDPEVLRIARWAVIALEQRDPYRDLDGVKPRWSDTERVVEVLRRRIEEAEGDEWIELIDILALHDPEEAARWLPEINDGLLERLDRPPVEWQHYLRALEWLGPLANPALPTLEAAAWRLERERPPAPGSWILEEVAATAKAIDPNAEETLHILILSGDRTAWYRLSETEKSEFNNARRIKTFNQIQKTK